METFISQFNWEAILIVAVSVSFVVEAIDRFTPSEITPKWILALVSFIITVIKADFDFSSWDAIRLMIFNVLLTMSVTILFYTYLGKWTIDKIFAFIRRKTEQKINV